VEFKNTKTAFEKKSMSKMFYKKMIKFPFRFFSVIFFAFWDVSLHGESKTTKEAKERVQLFFLRKPKSAGGVQVSHYMSMWCCKGMHVQLGSWERERAVERLDFDRSDLQKWNPR
jgi:hypothetical protein